MNEPDGYVEVWLKGEDEARKFYFKDIKTHGWVADHFTHHEQLMCDGKVQMSYYIYYDIGRLTFPKENVNFIFIRYNSAEFTGEGTG